MTTISSSILALNDSIKTTTTTKPTEGKESKSSKSLLGDRQADEKTALALGNDVATLEELLIESYRADPKGSKELINKIADGLNIDKSQRGTLTMDGLKRELELKYQRAVQNLEAFLQIMKNRFEIFKGMIQKLDIR